MAKFAAFVTTAADLVEVLKKEFSLDPATSLANRAQVASYAGRGGGHLRDQGVGQAHSGIRLHRYEAAIR